LRPGWQRDARREQLLGEMRREVSQQLNQCFDMGPHGRRLLVGQSIHELHQCRRSRVHPQVLDIRHKGPPHKRYCDFVRDF
jgi:hypothetical protein